MTIQDHVERWKDCRKCVLWEGRRHIVLGRGSIPCDVLFIGEAPGDSENLIGQPFVGPAGHLLDRIIARSIPARLTYAMTNLVCCFPREEKEAGINEPPKEAIRACNPRLVEFVRICQPRLVVLVGKLAKSNVIGAADFSLERDSQPEWIPEGKYLEFVDIVHPAAILRADITQRGLLVQRCVATLRDAVSDL